MKTIQYETTPLVFWLLSQQYEIGGPINPEASVIIPKMRSTDDFCPLEYHEDGPYMHAIHLESKLGKTVKKLESVVMDHT